MAKIIQILKKKGVTCFPSDRFNLDSVLFEPYQDEGQEFERSKIFETENTSGKIIDIAPLTQTSNFSYFLDGSRYTYKVADMSTTDGKFMPIIAGQLAAGVTERIEDKINKYDIRRKNVILLYSHINQDDLTELKEEIEKVQANGINFIVSTYNRKDIDIRPENFAIAKLQKMMIGMEIDLLTQMVTAGILKPDKILVIDGSLQFMEKKANDGLFKNVIGLSKSFNPNLTGLLKRKTHQIATLLTQLKFSQRTPVYKYPLKQNNRIIGAWYLRIHPEKYAKNPLDGIVKVEKIAVTPTEKDDGFETEIVDNISRSIILERNVTCHGQDNRWANHIYPIYLTEKMLKESFLSSTYFLNIF